MNDQPGSVVKMVPDGAAGSPLVDPAAIEARRAELWPELPPLRGIDYREVFQTELFERLRPLFDGFDYHAQTKFERPGYFFYNAQFSGLDALMYFAMLRDLRPQRIVEIG